MNLGQAQLGDVQRRYVKAPVQGKAQTGEQQTCLGLASLGSELRSRLGMNIRVRALCGIRVELRRQLLVRVRVRVRARARVRARVRVKAGVRVRVRVEGAPGRSVAWGAPRSPRRGPG